MYFKAVNSVSAGQIPLGKHCMGDHSVSLQPIHKYILCDGKLLVTFHSCKSTVAISKYSKCHVSAM